MIKQGSFSNSFLLPFVEVSFAGENVVVFDDIVFSEALAVEDWIEAVVEVGLLLPVLEDGFVPRLGFLVDHLDHFGGLLVFLLPWELQDISTVNLLHLTGWEFQGLDHGIDEGVLWVLGWYYNFLLFFFSESNILDGMFEDVIVGLGLRVLNSADWAVDHGFWGSVAGVGGDCPSILWIDNSGHE